MKYFFDSNVIIDALTNREGAVEDERKLLYSATVGEIQGVIAAKQITDIYYVLRKYVPSDSARRDLLSILLEGFEVIPVNKDILKKALESDVSDYEDALIDACAEISGATAIVSNDKKGFINGKIKAVSPEEALATISL